MATIAALAITPGRPTTRINMIADALEIVKALSLTLPGIHCHPRLLQRFLGLQKTAFHGLQAGYTIPTHKTQHFVMTPGLAYFSREPSDSSRKRHHENKDATYAEVVTQGPHTLTTADITAQEADAAFPPLQTEEIAWSTRYMETRFPPESNETLSYARAHNWCYERFAHLGGVDPSYVWDLDVGILPNLFRPQHDIALPTCPHQDCYRLWFANSHALAQYWNRYHVVSVPTFKCPVSGCSSGPPTTCSNTFGAHWSSHHKNVPLDDAMLQRIVELGVNPFYHHDTRRERANEVATHPHLDCPLRRSSFDARVQTAFHNYCV